MSMYGHTSKILSGTVAMAAARSVAGQFSCGMIVMRPAKTKANNTRRWMTVSLSNIRQA